MPFWIHDFFGAITVWFTFALLNKLNVARWRSKRRHARNKWSANKKLKWLDVDTWAEAPNQPDDDEDPRMRT